MSERYITVRIRVNELPGEHYSDKELLDGLTRCTGHSGYRYGLPDVLPVEILPDQDTVVNTDTSTINPEHKLRFVLPATIENLKAMSKAELEAFRAYHVATTYGDLVWAADKELERREIKKRLEYLRGALRAECISWDEIHELQSLASYIDQGDVELLEAAGVPEHSE